MLHFHTICLLLQPHISVKDTIQLTLEQSGGYGYQLASSQKSTNKFTAEPVSMVDTQSQIQ